MIDPTPLSLFAIVLIALVLLLGPSVLATLHHRMRSDRISEEAMEAIERENMNELPTDHE